MESNEYKELKKKLLSGRKNGYDRVGGDYQDRMEAYCAGYMAYLDAGKTERLCAAETVRLAEEKGFGEKLRLYETVERLSPAAFRKVTGKDKVISANVDFYSGLVYEMLGIPEDLFTPMFAVSRIAGWCAHRIEELTTGGRIMRPAYRALPVDQKYVPLDER